MTVVWAIQVEPPALAHRYRRWSDRPGPGQALGTQFALGPVAWPDRFAPRLRWFQPGLRPERPGREPSAALDPPGPFCDSKA